MITVYGDNGLTLDGLRDISPVRPDKAGGRWQPVKHSDVADNVLDECLMRGWEVTDQKYSTSRKGADCAGAFGLRIKGSDGASLAMPEGTELALGFLNSNARRSALRVTLGASVACCTNGMCSGQLMLRQRHDGSFDLADSISDALDAYAAEAEALPYGIAALKETELSPATANEILMQAGRAKLVGWSAIGKVDEEYRKPTFAEHGKGTAWALLQAFTYAARANISPVRQMDTFRTFQGMLPTVPAAVDLAVAI